MDATDVAGCLLIAAGSLLLSMATLAAVKPSSPPGRLVDRLAELLRRDRR